MKINNINFFLATLSLVILGLLSACGSDSQTSNGDNSNPPSTSVEQTLSDSVKDGIDGIFVYGQKGNMAALSYTAGIQDRINQTPAKTDVLFKIASISKLFIAVSAVKTHHLNLLSLDDKLAFWLPELSDRIENSDQITLRMMLQHRSGIADFDSQSGFSWQDSHSDIDTTLAFALDKPADFSPDAQYQYSNTNYLLAAKILDRALGYDHGIFIHESILTPLGMINTYLQADEIDLSLLAKGYWLNIERSSQAYVIPGGSMISTLADTASFMRALNTGTLLTAEERSTYKNVYSFDHSGWLPGYQSIARYYADKDLVLVQFINTTGGSSEEIAATTFDAVYRQF